MPKQGTEIITVPAKDVQIGETVAVKGRLSSSGESPTGASLKLWLANDTFIIINPDTDVTVWRKTDG